MGQISVEKSAPPGSLLSGNQHHEFSGGGASLRNRRSHDEHQTVDDEHFAGVRARKGAFDQTPTAVSKDLSPEARALLDTLASGEAKDYNVLNGGGTFDSYARHPDEGGHRAAGRYQFLPSTWNAVRQATGAKDFGPEAQDKGAWWLAQSDYKKRTGRDLQTDLASKDPATIAGVGRALGPTWVSLNGSFSGKYDRFLSRQTAASTPVPGGSGTPDGTLAGDLSGEATYSNGRLDDVKGFIVHHTGGGGTPEGVVHTLNQRGLGVQFVMGRDGKIYRGLPDGARGAHILRSEINDLNNSNTMGMEVIAKDDADVTPAQVAAGKAFLNAMTKLHPGLQVFGHGEVNPHHKMASEGHAIVEAFRAGRAAPATDPNYVPPPVPIAQRNLRGYMGGDAPVKVAVTDDSAFKLGKAFVSSSPLLQTSHGGGSNILAGLHASWQRYADAHGGTLVHPGTPGHPLHVPPLGVTPSLYQAYDHSRKRGDTVINHSPTYNVHGGDAKMNMDHARMSADRGTKDLVRNLRAVEQ